MLLASMRVAPRVILIKDRWRTLMKQTEGGASARARRRGGGGGTKKSSKHNEEQDRSQEVNLTFDTVFCVSLSVPFLTHVAVC